MSEKPASSIDLILLGLLNEGPMGAYDLASHIERRSLKRLLKISTPAVYKNCKKLHKLGLIDGQTVKEGEAPDKVVYTINDQGRSHFKFLMEYFVSELRPIYFDFNIVIWNLEKLNKKEGERLLERLQETIDTTHYWISRHEKDDLSKESFAARSVVKGYRMFLATMSRWVRLIRKEYKEG